MKYIKFDEKEKAEMFDKIAEKFYYANFGQASKADIELLMFNFYIQKMINDNKNSDNTIDYRKCSDYLISKELGITQQRVRNLKIKNQLVNTIDFEWEKSFVTLINNARYDEISHKVTLNIPDPNLFIEIQNYIEENGAYIEKQLNNKVLQIRAEYFIDLVVAAESDYTKKEIIKKLKKLFASENKDNLEFDKKNIGKTLIDITANLATISTAISDCISPQNIIGQALLQLIK